MSISNIIKIRYSSLRIIYSESKLIQGIILAIPWIGSSIDRLFMQDNHTLNSPVICWIHDDLTIDSFSINLVNMTHNVAIKSESIFNSFVNKGNNSVDCIPAITDELLGIAIPNDHDIEITCLNENKVYIIHPRIGVIDRKFDTVWSSEFSAWFWGNIEKYESGYLIWLDSYASTPEKSFKIRRDDWIYKRRTIVSFRKVYITQNLYWTIAVEGHETHLLESKIAE